jgi:ABC-type transport system substrate-binding protein
MWGYTQDEYDIQEFIGRASTTDDLERLRADMTELFAFISRDMPFIFTSSGYNVSGYRSNVRGFPGEATEDGYEATDYFQTTYRADPSRLYSFEDA